MANFSSFKSNIITESTSKANITLGDTTVVYDTAASIPLTGNSEGDRAFAKDNNSYYVWNGSGWYTMSLVNQSPTITGESAEYTLAPDRTPTVVTLTGEDADGDTLVWSYSVTSGTLEDTDVAQADNVFTITPGTVATSFELTFSVTDGVNVSNANSTFTLTLQVWTSPTYLGEVARESSSGATTRWGFAPQRIRVINPNTIAIGDDFSDGSKGYVDIYQTTDNWSTYSVIQRLTNPSGQSGYLGTMIDYDEGLLVSSAPFDTTYNSNDPGVVISWDTDGSTFTQRSGIMSQLSGNSGERLGEVGLSCVNHPRTPGAMVIASTQDQGSTQAYVQAHYWNGTGNWYTTTISNNNPSNDYMFGKNCCVGWANDISTFMFALPDQSNNTIRIGQWLTSGPGGTFGSGIDANDQPLDLYGSFTYGTGISVSGFDAGLMHMSKDAKYLAHAVGTGFKIYRRTPGTTTFGLVLTITNKFYSTSGSSFKFVGDALFIGDQTDRGPSDNLANAGAFYVYETLDDGLTWSESTKIYDQIPASNRSISYGWDFGSDILAYVNRDDAKIRIVGA